jgi:phosphoribosyl 1,2-cyclic phosphodiesterase
MPVAGGSRFSVTFWGTRGSIACAGPHTVKYGGNTSCLEVLCGDERLIFDAGSGLPMLGRQILANEGPVDTQVFLTHTHLDHIIGMPFFALFHIPGLTVPVYAGHLKPVGMSLHGVLSDMMRAPLFPVPPEIFGANVSFNDFEAGEVLYPMDGVTLRTAPLNHPNGACGYRVDYEGKAIAYITDTEHYPDRLDERVLSLVQDASIMIYDATYTDEEYEKFVGFGHSTWQEGIKLADAANVETLVIFHHDPSHTDDMMDEIAADVEKARPGTIVAREGLTLNL